MNQLVDSLYSPYLTAARKGFESGASKALLDPELDPEIFELFLINYCSRGVRMTEPVEGWIRRAGERCREVGLARLGAALEKHAKQEADHHLMMIADTHNLVERWNRRHAQPIEA